MTDKELIQALRENAEWAQANEWETPITLGDNLTEAADRLEALLSESERLRAAEWHSVSEIPPEPGEYIAHITYAAASTVLEFVGTYGLSQIPVWVDSLGDRYFIDAWMHLPAPPDAEEGN